MNKFARITGLFLLFVATLLLPTQHAVGKAADVGSKQDKALIMSAMSAAPLAVAKGATIVVMKKGGEMRTLRAGTNGFTCMPDNPATPGPDPMCMDRPSLDWVQAWVSQTAPARGKVGLMYMLAGGTDASNTDPHAQKPTASNHWIKTGPHIMVVGADPSFYASYPSSPKPDPSKPYVMWPGTPYQHLMAPIR
ncbi:hypothetical protein [Cyanobium sp. ATX 6F1]|uniref:hypothetical protein n=1 Tax=unclassified Cyanobium TaxID=2627006 RepID=UPI0020CCC3AF|nr:hypothetical protein [Cyanobium sp. ATX 6F1]MCP9915542.1 hypothetical protein [Cyanobium sp. ATX 6F1]